MGTHTSPNSKGQGRTVAEVLRKPVKVRTTPLSARGEPAVWFMGMSLILCLVLIAGLLGRVVAEGLSTFWPGAIERVALDSGQVLQGVRTKDELDPSTGLPRFLLRVGNRELGTPFVWTDEKAVTKREFSPTSVFLERREWGPWIGEPHAVVKIEYEAMPESGAFEADGVANGKAVTRKATVDSEGKAVVEVTTTLAKGPEESWTEFSRLHADSLARYEETHSLTEGELGWINTKIERTRLAVRQAEINAVRLQRGEAHGLSWAMWSGLLLATGGGIALCFGVGKTAIKHKATSRSLVIVAALIGVCALVLEGPWHRKGISAADLEGIRAEAARERTVLEAEYREVLKRIELLRAEDQKYRFVVVEPGGKFAPLRQSSPNDPMLVSQVVRAVRPNELSLIGKIGVYLSRTGEFLGGQPREANTEGGVFPVIFGTVIMTLLLSAFVVPLGVIAALYLREYAKQGPVTSAIRVAVNNLAGVPSIVYGVFGLGFFCYTIGSYIDHGPNSAATLNRLPWWWMIGGMALLAMFALAVGNYLRRTRATELSTFGRTLGPLATMAWLGAAGLLGLLFVTTPYFHGFFEAHQPSPVFGGRGLLWGSLTLALLTLPVVIVATEEAIAAVPQTMREGSYGAGASKWQTIRRIVLPQAMPGIMTGMILAMARGAGEVAPLMLVGAVKLAPDLPVSEHAPFVHPERSFMHLGFHIYDLGFQSPDSEAARPLVWTTTLLLISIVLVLNLAAIIIRSRLRSKLIGSAV